MYNPVCMTYDKVSPIRNFKAQMIYSGSETGQRLIQNKKAGKSKKLDLSAYLVLCTGEFVPLSSILWVQVCYLLKKAYWISIFGMKVSQKHAYILDHPSKLFLKNLVPGTGKNSFDMGSCRFLHILPRFD